MSDTILYTQPRCADCETAKAWLADRGIHARIRNIRDDDQWLFAFMDTGSRVTPTLVLGDTVLAGFDPDRWLAALEGMR